MAREAASSYQCVLRCWPGVARMRVACTRFLAIAFPVQMPQVCRNISCCGNHVDMDAEFCQPERAPSLLRSARSTGVAAIAVIAACIYVCDGAFACDLPEQGDVRVDAIIDGRTFTAADGREIRLAGLELPPTREARQAAIAALATLALNKTVTLRGVDDAPDRYGRQSALVFLDKETSVQAGLLTLGAAIASPFLDTRCIAELTAAETKARTAKRGIWADPIAIKNTERPGDILAAIGQFGVVEGKVLSVRQAGAVTYVNFGRRWTDDFAITISKQTVAAFEDAKISLKSFENRRIRVRGWIGQRGGPRIEVFRVEQVDVLGENEPKPGRGRAPGQQG